MAKSRLIGSYPVIGIRPTIDGRRGALKVRESLEEQTMNMAKSAAKLISDNVFYSDGEPVKVIIADTTIGRVAEAAACADKFKKAGVDITLTVTPCWCYGAETMDMDVAGDFIAMAAQLVYIKSRMLLPQREETPGEDDPRAELVDMLLEYQRFRQATAFFREKGEEGADMLRGFLPISRTVYALKHLKIISFGPRPRDFMACNAPIKGLYELGVEIEENSELDLLVSYKAHAGDARIPAVCEDMKQEMGEGKYYADMLERMAQFELTLLDWAENHKGARKYVAFADKCWPAFPEQFGFEPCYVNSRLASRGIPVACEVDIYGALSEYIGACISHDAVTLLDINNSVPASLYEAEIKGKFDYTLTDTFMGFHCGNTPSCKLCADRAVKYQLIQHRLLEPAGSEPDFTRGTLEADLAASQITFYRLQCDSDGVLRSYIAEGEILPVKTGSFGGIGIFAIPEMGRFYRHVLIQKRYPHHGAVAFGHYGKLLFEVFKFLGVGDIAYNQPKSLPYPTENPFA